ncbi:MAG TPA: DNA methyltransferase [Sedimentisphaerales bacterium]|nr:DNA methyltransferase [Sedimentisphaerales bacterium]
MHAINEIAAEKLGQPAYTEPLTVSFLKSNPHLMLDTAFFGAEFIDRLLAGFEDIDIHTGGQLLHSENFQAIRLLSPKYAGSLTCIYIDPPYNTDASPIIYKNGYRHSSWLTLMSDRLLAADSLRLKGAIVCVAIDDYECPSLVGAVNSTLGYGQLATIVVRSKPQGRPTTTGFSANHEYGIFWGDEHSVVGRMPREGSKAQRYPHRDEKGIYAWANFRKSGSDSDRKDRKRSFYPLFVKDDQIRIPEMTWSDEDESWHLSEQPGGEEVKVLPMMPTDQRRYGPAPLSEPRSK